MQSIGQRSVLTVRVYISDYIAPKRSQQKLFFIIFCDGAIL